MLQSAIYFFLIFYCVKQEYFQVVFVEKTITEVRARPVKSCTFCYLCLFVNAISQKWT